MPSSKRNASVAGGVKTKSYNTGAGAGAGAGASSGKGSRKRPRTGGDDLVDADAFVAGDSGDEDGAGFAVDLGSGDDSGDEDVGASVAAGERKDAAPAASTPGAPPAQKKRRKKKNKKGRGGQQSGPDPSLGDAATQAAFFWSVFCGSIGKSMTELERGHPPTAESFIATQSIPHGTPAIAEAVRLLVPSYQSSIMWSKGVRRVAGRPQLIVVCSSARRCVQLLKPLAAFKTRVAKLFAKHVDIKQQASLLASGTVTLAVGTPARIRKLADQGHLVFGTAGAKHQPPQVVVFDMTRDAKTLTVLSRHDTCHDAMVLYKEHLGERVADGTVKLALF